MADSISYKIEGLEALKATFQSLATKDADAAVRKALKAGAVIEQAAISAAAPMNVEGGGGSLPPGALKNDIEIHNRTSAAGNPYVVVEPGKYTGHIAKFVEWGHRLVRGGYSRETKSGKFRGPGKEIGFVDAHPFIRPAYEQSQQEVADAIATTLIAEIERLAAKGNK